MSGNCENCNLNFFQPGFLKSDRSLGPLYFINDKMFCSAKCTTRWHDTFILKSSDEDTKIDVNEKGDL